MNNYGTNVFYNLTLLLHRLDVYPLKASVILEYRVQNNEIIIGCPFIKPPLIIDFPQLFHAFRKHLESLA